MDFETLTLNKTLTSLEDKAESLHDKTVNGDLKEDIQNIDLKDSYNLLKKLKI
jgi:hypothetical protein